MQANTQTLVARVNFYGWSLRGQFFYNSLTAGQGVRGFTDSIFLPVVNDLADLLLEMLGRGLSGLYHTVSCGRISKYAVGVAIANRFSLDGNLMHPTSWKGERARRSPNFNLNTGKLAATFGAQLNPGLRNVFSARPLSPTDSNNWVA